MLATTKANATQKSQPDGFRASGPHGSGHTGLGRKHSRITPGTSPQEYHLRRASASLDHGVQVLTSNIDQVSHHSPTASTQMVA
jgi:hypothetical protein